MRRVTAVQSLFYPIITMKAVHNKCLINTNAFRPTHYILYNRIAQNYLKSFVFNHILNGIEKCCHVPMLTIANDILKNIYFVMLIVYTIY